MVTVHSEYSIARGDRIASAALKALLATGVALGAVIAQPAFAQETASDAADSSELVVTAQRREQSIMTVPLSITGYTTEQMDRQGIRQIDDISRLTPSLRFVRSSGVSGNNGANISIRGISSDVGASTTAIYIDDTPIQIRSIGYWGGNPFPRVFDLERVEVLRGPQGTLFGASAEGGAVRFITPQPKFDDPISVYGRSEISTTKNGSESYEAGVAMGGAVSETLAVRASGWYRRDGGYIDWINPSTGTLRQKDINSEQTYAARLALSWRPVEELTITPAIYYQSIEAAGRNQYWEGYGDQGSQDYVSGLTNREPWTDRFWMPSLKVEYGITDNIDLISNTSYFKRRQQQKLDYATYLSTLRSGNPFGSYANKDANNALSTVTTRQKNFVQEVRLQSYAEDQLIDWTVGGYYSNTKQFFTNFSQSGRIPGVISAGYPQINGIYNLYEYIDAQDEQIAGFASVDVKPIKDVKITLAARYTNNKFNVFNLRDGPTNSGRETQVNFNQSENFFTPKIGVSWQVDRDNMVYASASKGFRPGGAQPIVDPNFCAADLATLGVTNSPSTYDKDSLWAYEVGSKNKLFGGAVTVDANAYLIKWSSLQQAVRLPTCSFTFIGNLGDATSKGVDLQLAVTPVTGLTLGANLGYNKTTADDDVVFISARVRNDGQRIGGPSWTGALYGQFDQPLSDSVDGYLRVDYSFQNDGIVTNPQGTFGYDAGLPALDSTDYASLRAGVRFAGLDLSAFVNNLTNSDRPISRSHDSIGSPLYYAETYRPRTIGLTAQFRY